MAIARDTSAGGAIEDLTTANTTFAYNAGTGTGDRYMIVAFAFENGSAARSLDTVTYNGVSMTKVREDVYNTTSFRERLAIFELVNPATGSNNFVLTFSASVSQDLVTMPQVWTGVDQTTPRGNTVNDGSSTTSAEPRELSMTFSADSVGAVFIVQNRGDSDPIEAHDANTTIIDSGGMGSGSAGLSYASGYRGPEATGASYDLGYANSGVSSEWVSTAVELLIASGGGGGLSMPVARYHRAQFNR